MNLKQIYAALILIIACSTMISCDKVPDEQFTKKVIFTRNGFQNFEMSFDNSQYGVFTQPASISISGTSVIGKDVTVGFAVDDSALSKYNFDKFRFDSVAYYSILPSKAYIVMSNEVTIKAGQEFATLPIIFNLDSIDKYTDYVLPVTINKTSDFVIGDKGTATALMHIVIKNGFSGNYTTSGASLKDSRSTLNLNDGTSVTLNSVSTKVCNFYAGDVVANTPNKKDYLVEVTVNTDSTLSLKAVNNKIALQFDAPSFQKNNYKNVMQILQSGNAKTYTLYLNYSYLDFNSGDGSGIRKTFSGRILRSVSNTN